MQRLAVRYYPPVSLDLFDCDACEVDGGVCLFHAGFDAACNIIDRDQEGAKVLQRLIPEA